MGASQGDAALLPHGSQEEDAVRKPSHLAAAVSQTAAEARVGTQVSSGSSCDSGICQKYIANFTQVVFKTNLEVS